MVAVGHRNPGYLLNSGNSERIGMTVMLSLINRKAVRWRKTFPLVPELKVSHREPGRKFLFMPGPCLRPGRDKNLFFYDLTNSVSYLHQKWRNIRIIA